MNSRRPTLSSLWLLLLLFPITFSTFAQTPAPNGGMEVKVRLLEDLDTSKTKTGQLFSATVAEPVMSGKRTVLSRGTAIQGRVTDVIRPGRLHTPASISLTLTNVIGTRGNDGIQAHVLQVDGSSHAVRNVALIGGGAAAGAVLGGVADGGKGALIGAGVGAGAGTVTAYLTGKKELVLPAETLLTFVVDAESIAPAQPPRATIVDTSLRRGRGDERPNAAHRDDRDAFDSLIFSERDQAIIRAYYYSGHGRNLPPGLAKRDGNLPPGLEKQLRANGSLPPGLQKRAQPFPVELERQLPRLPSGYSRMMVEGRAINVGSDNRVVDVFVIF